MKLALFHNLPSGGAKRHTAEQVRELARRGHDVVEFVPSTADRDFCSLRSYVRQQRVFATRPAPPPRPRVPLITPYLHARDGFSILRETDRVNRLMAQEIDAGRFDVVLAKDCQVIMNPYVLRYLETTSVFQCHHGLRHYVESAHRAINSSTRLAGLADRLKAAYYTPARVLYERRFRMDEARNLRSASTVVTNSRFSQQLLSRTYGVEAGLLYPGINTETFRPRTHAKQPYVLCVGALIYGKGYRFLVSALARVPVERRPALVVAANSVDPAETALVRALAERSQVRLTIETITDDERLALVYSQAAVFVYAPVQEALGMAPLEAMACGTPVVAVAEGGVCETVQDGVTGRLVDRDPEHFAHQLDELLSNRTERSRMAEAAVDYVRAAWSWARAVDRLEQILSRARAPRIQPTGTGSEHA